MIKQVGWVVLRNILLAALALFVFLTVLFIFLQRQPGEFSDIYILNRQCRPLVGCPRHAHRFRGSGARLAGTEEILEVGQP